VDDTPDDKTQTNVTAPEWPSMRTNNQGWDSCGNTQARVEAADQIIAVCDVTTAAHDKPPAEPRAQLTMASLEQAGIALPKDAAGAAQPLPATYDSGEYSETAAAAVEHRGFDPSRATGRQRHQAEEAEVTEPPATTQERMAAQVRTPEGRAWYARRQVIVKRVVGQSKDARGCRRFLLRGLDNIRGEWRLGCLPHTLLKLWRYAGVPSLVSGEEKAP